MCNCNWSVSIARRLDSLSCRSNWQRVIAVTCAIVLSRRERKGRERKSGLWKMIGHWFRVIPLKTSSRSRAQWYRRELASLEEKQSVNGARTVDTALLWARQRNTPHKSSDVVSAAAPSIRHSSGGALSRRQ